MHTQVLKTGLPKKYVLELIFLFLQTTAQDGLILMGKFHALIRIIQDSSVTNV